jgi:ribonuclease R
LRRTARSPQRYDSHRLIEEFMIAANVAAASTLEEVNRPCMYRIHDAPDPQKLEALRQVLDGLDLRLARGQVIKPGLFRRILDQVRGRPHAAMVHELVLRSQSQAAYAPDNMGHFGLALPRYAHFTSPIRRYADLLVHRALIVGLGLGHGGLAKDAEARFAEQGRHISMTERRAQAAEREAVDRFTAAFLKARIGEIFSGRINGVTRFGLFVTLDDSGADGLIPISTLPEDYYDHLAAEHSLVGRRWGRRYSLGERVRTRLTEADPITGGMVLELIEGEAEALEAPTEAATEAAGSTGWDPLSGDRSAAAARSGAEASSKRRGKGAGATPRRRRKARNVNS